MRVSALFAVLFQLSVLAAGASAQAPQGGPAAGTAGAAMPETNVGTAGQQDMTPGATVTGVGPGGMMGSQSPINFTFGNNASTANSVDRTMGAMINGQEGVMRGALPTAPGMNYTTVYGRDMRAGATAAMGQFGANNAQIGPVPNVNASTAAGRQVRLESGATSGGASRFAGTNNGPQLGMGSNANTAGMRDMRTGSIASMGRNAALSGNYWGSASQQGRNWSRGAASNLPPMSAAAPMQVPSRAPIGNVQIASPPQPMQFQATPSLPQGAGLPAANGNGYFGGGVGNGFAPAGNVQGAANLYGVVPQQFQR